MTTTTYYNLNIVEGTDIVNPLTVDNPNYEKIDEVLHDNAVSGVTLATELTNSTIHALTRENSDCSVIRFIATSRWKAGDSVTVDGVPVLALLPSGETLPDGAYVINANVLCVLTGTNLTVYVSKSSANASDIAYNDTNVEEALNSLNTGLSGVNSTVSTLTTSLAEVNGNLSRYNPVTDSLDIYYNGELVGSLYLGFKEIRITLNDGSTSWVMVKEITGLSNGQYTFTVTVNRTDSGPHDAKNAVGLSETLVDGLTDFSVENSNRQLECTKTYNITSVNDKIYVYIYNANASYKYSGKVLITKNS